MIVIPAAGDGTRFREAGYEGPKHLLPLGGIPMIDRVIGNVSDLGPSRDEVLIVTKDLVGSTRGAVDTICRVADRIPRDEPLIIANCDQLILLPAEFSLRGDGTIFTFRSGNPAHSYVVTDEQDRITSIMEKIPISDRAVSGVYWFQEAGPFLDACELVLKYAGRAELYISSALNTMLTSGAALYALDVPTAILGTPEDFQRFEVALACADLR